MLKDLRRVAALAARQRERQPDALRKRSGPGNGCRDDSDEDSHDSGSDSDMFGSSFRYPKTEICYSHAPNVPDSKPMDDFETTVGLAPRNGSDKTHRDSKKIRGRAKRDRPCGDICESPKVSRFALHTQGPSHVYSGGHYQIHPLCASIGISSCFQLDATSRRAHVALVLVKSIQDKANLSSSKISGVTMNLRLAALSEDIAAGGDVGTERECAYPYALQEYASEYSRAYRSTMSSMEFSESTWSSASRGKNPHAMSMQQKVVLSKQQEKRRTQPDSAFSSSLVSMSTSVANSATRISNVIDEIGVIQRDWTLRYRPVHIDDVVGNREAREKLRQWIGSKFEQHPTEERAPSCCLLYGPTGIGKRCILECIARDMRCDLVYAEEEDQRTLSRLSDWIYHSARSNTRSDTGRGMIIVVDSLSTAAQGSEHAGCSDEEDETHSQETRRSITPEMFGASMAGLWRRCNPIVFVANDTDSKDVRTAMTAAGALLIDLQRLKEDELMTLAYKIKECCEYDAQLDVVQAISRDISDAAHIMKSKGSVKVQLTSHYFGHVRGASASDISLLWSKDRLRQYCLMSSGDARKLVMEMGESLRKFSTTDTCGVYDTSSSATVAEFNRVDDSTHALSGGIFTVARQLIKVSIASPSEAGHLLHHFPDAPDVFVYNMMSYDMRFDRAAQLLDIVSDVDVLGGWNSYRVHSNVGASRPASEIGAWFLPNHFKGDRDFHQSLTTVTTNYPPELLSGSRQHYHAMKSAMKTVCRAFSVASKQDARYALQVAHQIRTRAFQNGSNPWNRSTEAECSTLEVDAYESEQGITAPKRIVGLVEYDDERSVCQADNSFVGNEFDAWGYYSYMLQSAGYPDVTKNLEFAEASVAYALSQERAQGDCSLQSMYTYPSSGIRRLSGGKAMSRTSLSVSNHMYKQKQSNTLQSRLKNMGFAKRK